MSVRVADHRASSALLLLADSATAAAAPLPPTCAPRDPRALLLPDASEGLAETSLSSKTANARSSRLSAPSASRGFLFTATAAEQIHSVTRTFWAEGFRRAASFKCRCAFSKSGSGLLMSSAPRRACAGRRISASCWMEAWRKDSASWCRCCSISTLAYHSRASPSCGSNSNTSRRSAPAISKLPTRRYKSDLRINSSRRKSLSCSGPGLPFDPSVGLEAEGPWFLESLRSQSSCPSS
mmetsp:Transcript_20316/g.36134  ORF Transcript_20316/g.36134 Transcript_20316/m.36134 type:complete len:238 (+) Transcript_20316:2373-3086(+)